MKRYIVVAVVVVLSAVMAAPVSAHGATRIDVEGTWEYWPTGDDDIREHSRYTVIRNTDAGNWYGTFAGTQVGKFVVVVRNDLSFALYHERITFTGCVNIDHCGTMTILTYGRQVPGGMGPGEGGPWSGHWFVRNGTGDLEGIRGHGTWGGGPFPIPYEGKVRLP